MKCTCTNELSLQMAAKVVPKGCKLLTNITVIATIQCEKCGKVYQIPISNTGSVTKKE